MAIQEEFERYAERIQQWTKERGLITESTNRGATYKRLMVCRTESDRQLYHAHHRVDHITLVTNADYFTISYDKNRLTATLELSLSGSYRYSTSADQWDGTIGYTPVVPITAETFEQKFYTMLGRFIIADA